MTYDFIDFKSSRMDTVRASQELMKMKIRHKQLGCNADNQKQRRSFCLIATACVSHFGLNDDCHLLTVLRNFRDHHLLATSEGRILVDEYYVVAPKIIQKVNDSPKADELWNEIYQHISSWVNLIEHDELDKVVACYKEYLNTLRNRLFV